MERRHFQNQNQDNNVYFIIRRFIFNSCSAVFPAHFSTAVCYFTVTSYDSITCSPVKKYDIYRIKPTTMKGYVLWIVASFLTFDTLRNCLTVCLQNLGQAEFALCCLSSPKSKAKKVLVSIQCQWEDNFPHH